MTLSNYVPLKNATKVTGHLLHAKGIYTIICTSSNRNIIHIKLSIIYKIEIMQYTVLQGNLEGSNFQGF